MIFRVISNVGIRTVLVTVAAVVVLLTRGVGVFEGMLPEGMGGKSAATEAAEAEAESGDGAMSWLDRILPTKSDQPRGAKFEKVAGSEAKAPSGAGKYLFDVADGLLADGPIAAMAGNRPVFISDVIDGYVTAVGTAVPAEITKIRPITGCRLTPPEPGSRVGHVTAAESGIGLPLLTYDDQVLARGVQDFVADYRKTGGAEVALGPDVSFQAYDVAVTETKRPVYLVLVNQTGHRIWNLHLAPGARIERVVLLAGDHAGIANLDPVVPVEVISAEGLAACNIRPAYALNLGNRLFEVLRGPSGREKSEATQALALAESQAAAWNTWFRDSFGIPAEDTRAGFDQGTISVVGPVPGAEDPKAVYAPLQGSRIRMTQDRYFEISGQSSEAESFAGRVKAIATSFAFGDLSYLRQGVAF